MANPTLTGSLESFFILPVDQYTMETDYELRLKAQSRWTDNSRPTPMQLFYYSSGGPFTMPIPKAKLWLLYEECCLCCFVCLGCAYGRDYLCYDSIPEITPTFSILNLEIALV